MAIYKPKNCVPGYETIDLTSSLPIHIECTINTSNSQVTGYSVRLLDENNNQVFPHPGVSESITDCFIDNYYNGSHFDKPFIIGTGTPDGNQIIYSNNIYKDSANNTINISNGHSYKWILKLYQANNSNSYANGIFDMDVTNGVVMGSNYKRLQTKKSDKILQDYYVQLYKSQSMYGSRGLIKTYDSTYGHVYMVEGENGFSEVDVVPTKADSFRVYKYGNNPNNLQTSQKVDYKDPRRKPIGFS